MVSLNNALYVNPSKKEGKKETAIFVQAKSEEKI